MHRPLLLGIVALLSLAPEAPAQSLRGSRSSVEGMYRQALNHDLHFYDTATGVRRAVARGEFVELHSNRNYELASVSHPYVLPATRTFVERLASQYRSACGERLVVTSAIRPRSQRLANGAAKSVHPTGMAIDLRKPTKASCLSWLRSTLLELDRSNVIEAIEERNPPHFHVAVFPEPYRRYAGGARFATADRDQESESRTAEDGARTHKVRAGESLWTIARRNRVSVEVIKSANDLRGSRIVAGQVLVIPSNAR